MTISMSEYLKDKIVDDLFDYMVCKGAIGLLDQDKKEIAINKKVGFLEKGQDGLYVNEIAFSDINLEQTCCKYLGVWDKDAFSLLFAVEVIPNQQMVDCSFELSPIGSNFKMHIAKQKILSKG